MVTLLHLFCLLLLNIDPIHSQYFGLQSGSCVASGYNIVTDWHYCKQGIAEAGISAETNPIITNDDTATPPGCSKSTVLRNNVAVDSTVPCSSVHQCVCFLGTDCTNTNGVTINPAACYCGATACTASSGFYCFRANNLCSKSNSFVYIETGTCEDVANRKSLYTNEDCNFAAGALQLVDTSSILLGTNAGNVPRGCSTNIGANNVGLVVNPFPGSFIRCSKTYKCLCQLGSACTNTDGTAVNSLPCVCGSNFCTTNTGLVCGKCCKIVLVLKFFFFLFISI